MLSRLLFDLIKSLSKAEKRYISIYYKDKGATKYMELLKTIDKQEAYNLEGLKQKIGDNDSIFFSRQREVYDSLLKILRYYYSNTPPSSEYELRNMLQHVELLYKKSLYPNCLKQLKDIRKLAAKYEHHHILNEANRWERKIIYAQMDMKLLRSRMTELEDSSNEYAQLIQNKDQYWSVLFWMYSLIRQNAFVNADKAKKLEMLSAEKTLYLELLNDETLALSHEAKVLFYSANAFKAQIGGNIKQARIMAQKLMETLLGKKHLYKEDSSLYVAGLNILIFMHQMLGELDETIPYIKLLKDAPRTRLDSDSDILTRYYQAQLILLTEKKLFKEALVIIREIEQAQAQLKKELSPSGFEFFAAAILMNCHEYQEALEYLNILINKNKAKNRIDTQAAAKVLSLLCEYQLGNKAYVTNVTRNVRRFLKANDLLGEIEGLLLTFFAQVDSFPSNKDEQIALEELKKVIEAYQAVNGLKGFLAYFDLLHWFYIRNKSSDSRLPNNLFL